MIALRLLAMLAAALVFILPPMLLADAGTGGMSGFAVAGDFIALVLVSASFLYVGLVGERMRRRRSNAERRLGGLLLAVAMIVSLGLLVTRKDPLLLWSSGGLLGLSVLLFLSFVFPMIEPGQRPMRKRERTEPNLLKLS